MRDSAISVFVWNKKYDFLSVIQSDFVFKKLHVHIHPSTHAHVILWGACFKICTASLLGIIYSLTAELHRDENEQNLFLSSYEIGIYIEKYQNKTH